MVYLITQVVAQIIKNQTVGLGTNKLRGRRRKGFWYCPNICIDRVKKTMGKQERRWQGRGLNLDHQLRSTRALDCEFRQFFEDGHFLFSFSLLRPVISHVDVHPVGPRNSPLCMETKWPLPFSQQLAIGPWPKQLKHNHYALHKQTLSSVHPPSAS